MFYTIDQRSSTVNANSHWPGMNRRDLKPITDIDLMTIKPRPLQYALSRGTVVRVTTKTRVLFQLSKNYYFCVSAYLTTLSYLIEKEV